MENRTRFFENASTVTFTESDMVTIPHYVHESVLQLCKLQENATEVIKLPVCGTEEKKLFSKILSYTLMICISFVMFAMGCKVDVRKMWQRFKVPYGILIGFFCQFGIMPLLSFSVAKFLLLPRAQALVVLIMGCIPGGNASNLLCYWCGGDLDLSIAMTALSTLLAFAMMPLCLFLYARAWTTEGFSIPFAKISIVLAAFIVPVGIGIAINFWKPKFADRVAKVGAVFGLLILVVAGSLGIILYPDAWNIPKSFWIAGAILPIAGYTCGYVIAYLVSSITKSKELNFLQIRTIAVETGMQNTQMCTAVIQLNYTCTCMILEMYAYPLVFFVYQVAEALILCATYQIFKCIHHSRNGDISGSTRESSVQSNMGRAETPYDPRRISSPMTTFGEFCQTVGYFNENCSSNAVNERSTDIAGQDDLQQDKNQNQINNGMDNIFVILNASEEQTRL